MREPHVRDAERAERRRQLLRGAPVPVRRILQPVRVQVQGAWDVPVRVLLGGANVDDGDIAAFEPLIVAGMLAQAAALALIAAVDSFTEWAITAVGLGAGTAAVYPTLIAAIGDVAHPAWRARAVGVYRLWGDSGFALGALLAGVLADIYGLRTATAAIAALTAASGVLVWGRMYETRRRPVSGSH